MSGLVNFPAWKQCEQYVRFLGAVGIGAAALFVASQRYAARLAVFKGLSTRESLHLLRRGFGARQAALEEFDLAVVIRLVLGDVEPFSEIVHAHFGIYDGEPLVIALP